MVNGLPVERTGLKGFSALFEASSWGYLPWDLFQILAQHQMLLSGLLPRHRPFHGGHQKGQRQGGGFGGLLRRLRAQSTAAGAQTRNGYDLRNSFYHPALLSTDR